MRVVAILLFISCCFDDHATTGVRGSQLYTIDFTVPENFPMDREVGDLREKMAELGLGDIPSGSIFTLMTSEMSHPIIFRINSSSGKIYLNSPLDREEVCTPEPPICQLDFTVTVRRSDLIFLQIEVTVTDVNDKVPRFLLREKRIYIEEGALPGTTITLPSAEDLDSPKNGIKFYKLVSLTDKSVKKSSPFSEYFQLMPETRSVAGKLLPTLKIIKELDREKVAEFQFTLMAVDKGGLNGSLPVILHIKDINDNAPVWVNGGLYRRQIRECSKETFLFRLEARDADDSTLPNGHVTYRISEQSNDYLRINRQFYITGDRLYLSNSGFREINKNKITFVVTASDGRGKSNDATVELLLEDCNDHAPEIWVHNRTAAVVENAQTVSTLSLVSVADRDRGQNSEFSCQLNDTTHLEMEKATTVKIKGGGTKTYYKILTKTAAEFDREAINRYTVIIQCQDHGQPTLSSRKVFHVTILDANDNAPEFLHSALRPFLLPENAKQSAYVGRVQAVDLDSGLNGMLSYSLDAEGLQHFSIGPNGELHARHSLDREARDRYRFQVIARDRGSPPRSVSTTVTVSVLDVNDCAPQFSGEYYFELVESRGRTAIRKVLGKINATDRDLGSNATIGYRVVDLPADSQARFHVGWDGSLSVIGVVDREVTPMLHVVVVASDGGSPPLSTSTTITIRVLDLNDNAPTFKLPGPSGGYLNVSQTALPNTLLGELSASDPDEGTNGTVHYSLVGGGASLSRFTLFPDGRLVLVGSLADFHNPSKLVVKAEDGGVKPLSTVDTLEIRYVRGGGGGGGGGGGQGGDSQERAAPPRQRPGQRGSRSLFVFYGLAGLLLVVFFCVCGVLIYLYVRTRGASQDSRKRSRPAGTADVIVRRGTNIDGLHEKASMDASHEAMLTLSSKPEGDNGQASTVCVYNEHDNSYTHLTTTLRSPSYTCLPAASEPAYGLYGDHVSDRSNTFYKPWSQQSCNSPGPRRLVGQIVGNKSATMLYSNATTAAATSKRKGVDDSLPDTMTLKKGTVGGGPPIIKSAHSYAFLDNFIDADGVKSDTSADCYSTEKAVRTRQMTPDGLTTLKSPYVTSSFV